MTKSAEAIDKAFVEHWRRTFPVTPERTLSVVLLIRYSDWRPLQAPWWTGKQVSIIGADTTGNFFIRHSDGSVRYWDHGKQVAEIIAPSVADFCNRLVE